MQASVEFPSAAEGDSGRLILVLQTANALWRQGDHIEALRWLRRAAETADEEGNDARALALARTAAEIRDCTGIQSTPAPPPAASSAPPRRPSLPAPPLRVVPLAPRPEFDTFDEETPRPSLPPAASVTAPAPSPSSDSAAGHPPRSVPPRASTRTSRPPRPPSMTPPSSTRHSPPSAPPRASSSVPPSRGSGAGTTHPDAEISAPARAALRVSVMLLSASSRTLLVRVLDEGEALSSGCQEALLVPVGSGVDLRRLPSVTLTTFDGDENTKRHDFASHRLPGLRQSS